MWGLQKKTSYRSGQRKTFTMWCNQKLVNAGSNTMSVDAMKDELKNGVVLVAILEQLTGKRIPGINRNPKHTMTIMANLQTCWRWMQEEEGIDLGGINVSNALQGVEKVWLALIWRFILKYDLDGDDGGAVTALLEWVQPRTEERGVEVSNFTTNWRDGDAFLALFDSCVPGVVDIEAEKANDDPNQRTDKLQKAFDLFEEHLGVSQLLEPADLMVHRIDHKCVMTYVAAIKNASSLHEQRMIEMEEAKKNENLMHKMNGDKLYQEGMSKMLTARTDSEDALEDVTKNAQDKLGEPGLGHDDFLRIVEEATQDLAEVTSRFDLAVEKFEAAKTEYGLVEDDDMTEKLSDCDDRIRECHEFVENLQLDLKHKLDDLIADAKGQHKMDQGHEALQDTMAECGAELSNILEDARTKIQNSKNEQERVEIVNAARDRLKRAQGKFRAVKEIYKDAEDTFVNEDKQQEARDAQDECDKYADELLEQFEFGIEEALAGAGENDDLSDTDLLAIYHAFSIEVESFAEGAETADPGIERQPGLVRTRLNQIMKLLKDHKSQTDKIREKVLESVSKAFDAEGYP
eukprot:TRINITY_DN21595_c0_g1_i1.p1 TRINITY_DN21595_c0_g1~~TRINITY_DN21595_c0_g1_i1.p1  ORF type:complete len:575 (-),score=204.85 TRINITY_DN21595_c0_g1_i1:222-1946(-)